jgi:hypothetical protein
MINFNEMKFLSLRACSREAYKNAYIDTLQAAARLAEAFPRLEGKPKQEKHELLREAESHAHSLLETFDGKKPMIAALGLLMAIRVLERMVRSQATALRGDAQ